MKLIMYGVNRDTVSCDDVQKYRLDESTRKTHLKDIHDFDGVSELVLITTNNRNEYYLYIDEQIFQHGDFLRYLSHQTGKRLEEIILETYSKFNVDVIKHLYSLTSILSHMPEPLSVIERGLNESTAQGTVGTILNDLFNAAIRFTLSLYNKKPLLPLLNGEVPNAIQSIKQHYNTIENIDFLIIGNNETISQLVKYLIGEERSYLTILERNEKTTELVSNINDWLKLTHQYSLKHSIQSVDLNQLVYRLSKADIVIIGPSVKNAWLSHELLEEVHEMRPTAKNQLVLDLSGAQDESIFAHYQDLNYVQIDDTMITNYSYEEVEAARAFYDEYLTNQTNDFMDVFNLAIESNISQLPINNQISRKISSKNKLRCKA